MNLIYCFEIEQLLQQDEQSLLAKTKQKKRFTDVNSFYWI